MNHGQEDRPIREWLQEIQAEAVTLYILDARNAVTWLEHVEDLENFTEEWIQEEYGGGRYQLRTYVLDVGGTKTKGVSRTIRVGGAPGRGRQAQLGADSRRQDQAEESPRLPERVRGELEELRELRELVAQLRNPPAPPPDPFALALQISTMLQEAQRPLLEALAERATAGGGEGGDPVRTLRQAFRFFQELNPGAAPSRREDDPVGRGLAAALPLLDRLRDIAQAEHPGALPAGPPPADGAPGAPPAPAGASPAPGAPPAPPADPLLAELEPFLPRLHALAGTGADAGLWADVVVEQAPGLANALTELGDAEAEALVNNAIGQYPPLQVHRRWLTELLDAVRGPGEESTGDADVVG